MPDGKNGHLFSYEQVKPLQVDTDTTETLLRLGFNAWKDVIGHLRSDDQLRMMFPYDSREGVMAKKKQFAQFARHGALVVATDVCDSTIAGYAMGRNDISGGILARAYKRVAEKEKVYAWIAQVAVSPEYQGLRIGRRLVRRALDDFKPNQRPTAYVFEENQLMMGAMQNFGFTKSPFDQEGTPKYDYFGEDSDPVMQFRFQAQSVAEVMVAIDETLQQKP